MVSVRIQRSVREHDVHYSKDSRRLICLASIAALQPQLQVHRRRGMQPTNFISYYPVFSFSSSFFFHTFKKVSFECAFKDTIIATRIYHWYFYKITNYETISSNNIRQKCPIFQLELWIGMIDRWVTLTKLAAFLFLYILFLTPSIYF